MLTTTGTRILHGRDVIYTDEPFITDANVVDQMNLAVTAYQGNSGDIDYLYKYYKGEQPILWKDVESRPEINNKIVENRANEIVSFKTGYLMGEPVQYVAHCEADKVAEEINLLNEYMFEEDKASKDKEIADWMHICGTSYRLVLPNTVRSEDVAPFRIYTLDPRNTLVVYSSDIEHRPVMGITYTNPVIGSPRYCVYTENRYYEIMENQIVVNRPHIMGRIPIIEYPANMARLGAFEIVIGLLDALNDTASKRQDGLDKFVDALLLFHNVNIDKNEYDEFMSRGAIKFQDIDAQTKAEIKYIVNELNQGQTETLVQHQYQTVLEICGMPVMGNGTSDSSNNGAIILRNGWSNADARAKDTELMFKKSEKKFLEIVLDICRTRQRDFNLRLGNVEIRFTRRNYENILAKSQVLTTMLQQPKIHPLLAFEHSGMFSDPGVAYEMSKEYFTEHEQDVQEVPADENQDSAGDSTSL
jgi:SPP1 family phage portal protein